MRQPILSVKSLCCRYARAESNALTNVSFSVDPGEFLCITGKSGSGKSTLARCLLGILPRIFHADLSGEVLLEGGPVADIPTWQIGAQAGVVLQNPDTQLLAHTAEDDIALALHHSGVDANEIPARTNWALQAAGAAPFRARPVRELSAGQKQRAVMATALARRPSVLILDEPFSMLDPLGVAETLESVVALHRQYGLTILLLEHRIERVLDFATRAVVLEQGRVAYDGAPHWLSDGAFSRQYGLRNAALLRSQFERIWPTMRMQKVGAEAKGLTYAYPGQHPAIERLLFAVPCGATAIVQGRNGVGKTTLLKQFTGLLKPSRGQVWLGGTDVASLSRPALTQHVGYVPQIPQHMFHQKTVRAELARNGPAERGGDASTDTEAVLAQCDLQHVSNRHPLSLSGGEARRLAIAMASAKRPSLVLLDEPTIGMDGRRLAMFLELLAQLQERGTTVMLASNDTGLLSLPFENRIRLAHDHGAVPPVT